MSKRLVIALGGNALGKTPEEQLSLVEGTASTIVDLVEQGYDVVQSKLYEVRFPKGTDAAIVEKMSKAIEQVTGTDEFKATLEKYFAMPYYRDGATTVKEDAAEVELLKQLFGK